MLTISITLRRGIHVVSGVLWGVIAAAVIASAFGFTAANAASVCPAAAEGDVFPGDVAPVGRPFTIPEAAADRVPCREAGLRQTKHDGPVGARGKMQGAITWLDASSAQRHGRQPVSPEAGSLRAPSVDLSRLCRLTC